MQPADPLRRPQAVVTLTIMNGIPHDRPEQLQQVQTVCSRAKRSSPSTTRSARARASSASPTDASSSRISPSSARRSPSPASPTPASRASASSATSHGRDRSSPPELSPSTSEPTPTKSSSVAWRRATTSTTSSFITCPNWPATAAAWQPELRRRRGCASGAARGSRHGQPTEGPRAASALHLTSSHVLPSDV